MQGYWLQQTDGNRQWIETTEEQTMQTIEQFIEEHGLAMEVEYANDNPNMPDADPGMYHYLLTITHTETGRDLETPYSMGSALTDPPELPDVLDTLVSDAAMYENSTDLLDFAAELGYSELKDYPKVEQIYNTIADQADELKALIGDDAYETLLWETERQ